MFWMRNKENSFPICTLIWRPAKILQKIQHTATSLREREREIERERERVNLPYSSEDQNPRFVH